MGNVENCICLNYKLPVIYKSGLYSTGELYFTHSYIIYSHFGQSVLDYE